jgi:glycosyltransferase involved in cell wall biosynthesis
VGRDIKFSIITVVRNASQSIGKILSSIDEQGSENVEHIVVDGNSTDGTQILKIPGTFFNVNY